MSALGAAFAAAPRETQARLVAVLEAWRAVLSALGTPVPDAAQLATGQGASEASAALEAWDRWASAHDGPAVEIMLGRNAPTISPGWQAVERRARSSAPGAVDALSQLRSAYADAQSDALLTRLRFSDLSALWWLDARLQRQVNRPPSSSSGAAGALAVLLLLAGLAGGRRRGR